MPVNLVLVGPPGVGKGTQAAMLADRLGLTHLASGDVFRSEIAARTELGLTAKRFIDGGELVPDEVTIAMMESRIASERSKVAGIILDGFPRTVAQARALDAKLGALGIEIARVASLEIDDEVVVARLSGRRVCPDCGQIYHVRSRPPRASGKCDACGGLLGARADDNEETIRNRLVVFHQQTRPVLEYYEGTGRLHRVDGDRPAEDVYQSVIEGLRV